VLGIRGAYYIGGADGIGGSVGISGMKLLNFPTFSLK